MSDLISKKLIQDALIEKISRLNAEGEKSIDTAKEFIRFKRYVDGLTPSAEPDIVRCRDCMHRDIGDNGFESWSLCTRIMEYFDVCEDDYCSFGERKNDG